MSNNYINPYELSIWKSNTQTIAANPLELENGLYNNNNELKIFHIDENINGYIHCVYGNEIDGIITIKENGYPAEDLTEDSVYSNNISDYIGIIVNNDNYPYTLKKVKSIDSAQIVWYSKYVDYFGEEKFLIIGSDTMSTPARAQELKLHKKIDGSIEVTFKLFTNYYDSYEDRFVSNPFINSNLLANESKLKLKRIVNEETEWYDLVIKQVEENELEHSVTYTASDTFINNLSKTGYDISLSTDAGNNSGTVTELANKVIENSEWELDNKDSDTLLQFLDEAIYDLTFLESYDESGTFIGTATITNPLFLLDSSIERQTYTLKQAEHIYVPYSVIQNKSELFQLIYHEDGDYSIDENGVIYGEKNRFDYEYGGWIINGKVTDYIEDSESNIINIYIDNKRYRFKNNSIVSDKRGARLVRSQRTSREALLNKTVYLYNKKDDTSNNIYYGYKDVEYKSLEFAKNYLINGSNFTTTEGWFPGAGNSVSINTNNNELKAYLHINKHAHWIYNSTFESITSEINTISIGDYFIFRFKLKDEYTIKNNWRVFIGPYSINQTTYIPDTTNNYFEQENPLDSSSTEYWIKDDAYFTPLEIITRSDFEEYIATNIAYIFDGVNTYTEADSNEYSASTTYYKKEENCYYTKLKCIKPISRQDIANKVLGLFFDFPDNTDGYDFEYIHFYDCIPNITNIIELDEQKQKKEPISYNRFYAPDEYVPAITLDKYYYYIPNTKYTSADQIIYEYSGYTDNSDYLPIYNSYEKIKSIEAAESNIYNILQDLAETFESWVDFKINRNSNGSIKLVNWKQIFPSQFSANTNYYINSDYNIKIPFNQFVEVDINSMYNSNILYYHKINSDYVNITITDNYIYIPNNRVTSYAENNCKIYIYTSDDLYKEVTISEEPKENESYYITDYDNTRYVWNENTSTLEYLKLYIIKNIDSTKQYYLYTPYREDKKISYKEYLEQNNYLGFKYGINLNGITRELVSDEIVSKLIVAPNSNEYALNNNKSCDIQNAVNNPTKQKFLYDFSYYINKNLLSATDVYTDLYDSKTGYYTKINKIYNELKPALEQKNQYSIDITSLQAEGTVLQNSIASTATVLNDIETNFNDVNESSTTKKNLKYIYKLQTALDYYNSGCTLTQSQLDIKDDEVYAKLTSDLNKTGDNNYTNIILVGELQSYTQQTANQRKYKVQYKENRAQYTEILSKYNQISQNIDYLNLQLNKYNSEFSQKYNKYIQEGTWNSEEYIDDELYYLDALGVLNTSKSPQVTYNINIVDISSLEDYKLYNYKLGDRTFIEDPEFFGNNHKEEVIVTELEYHLDTPNDTVITVKNYKTRFEDLFQRITASVQSIEYSKGAYNRAASLVNKDGTLNKNVLSDTFTQNSFDYVNNKYVVINDNGITVADKTFNNVLKINATGILTSTDKGVSWTNTISPGIINANLITLGHINTKTIEIFADEVPAFRWDSFGINAYELTNGITNYNKFVRLDQYGLYGINKEGNNYVKFESAPTAWKSNKYYVSSEDKQFNLEPIFKYTRFTFESGVKYYYKVDDEYILVTYDTPIWSEQYYVKNPYTQEPEESYEFSVPPLRYPNIETGIELIYYYADLSTWTPNQTAGDIYKQIKDNSMFGLTYGGFFLKSEHKLGYVEISTENDIKVIQYRTNDTEATRVKIGLLSKKDEPELYGIRINDLDENPVMESTSNGDLWLKKILTIGPVYNNPAFIYTQLGAVKSYFKTTYSGETIGKETDIQSIKTYSKILSIHGTNDEYFTHSKYLNKDNVLVDDTDVIALYDDGFLYAQNAEIKGTIIAEAGKIAGFEISKVTGESLLKAEDSNNNIVELAPSHISLGKQFESSWLTSDFYVTNEGYLQAKNINVSGKLSTAVFEKNTTRLAGGSMIFKNANNILSLQWDNNLAKWKIKLKNDEGYDDYNNEDYISIIKSYNSEINVGVEGVDKYYIINSVDTINKYILIYADSNDTFLKSIEGENLIDILLIQLANQYRPTNKTDIFDVSNKYYSIINNSYTYVSNPTEEQFNQGKYYIKLDNEELYNDWIIGINSTAAIKPLNLLPNSITFNVPEYIKSKNKLILEPKIVIGDLTTLSFAQIGEYKPTSGLYAKDVVLNGMLTTSYIDTSGGKEIKWIAGMGGGTQCFIPKYYKQSPIPIDYRIYKDRSEIVLWAGAAYDDQILKNYDISQSNFMVTEQGTILAASGYFANSVIIDSHFIGGAYSNIVVTAETPKTPVLILEHTNNDYQGIRYQNIEFIELSEEDISIIEAHDNNIQGYSLYEKNPDGSYSETIRNKYTPEIVFYWKADGTLIDTNIPNWYRPLGNNYKIFTVDCNTSGLNNKGCYITAYDESENAILKINPNNFKYGVADNCYFSIQDITNDKSLKYLLTYSDGIDEKINEFLLDKNKLSYKFGSDNNKLEITNNGFDYIGPKYSTTVGSSSWIVNTGGIECTGSKYTATIGTSTLIIDTNGLKYTGQVKEFYIDCGTWED